MRRYYYLVRLADLASFDRLESLREAMRYARTCKDDHGGASVTRHETAKEGTDIGVPMARWTRGEDGKVRRVVVR